MTLHQKIYIMKGEHHPILNICIIKKGKIFGERDIILTRGIKHINATLNIGKITEFEKEKSYPEKWIKEHWGSQSSSS